MVNGLETAAMKKRQRKVAQIKMMRFSLGVTRMDKVRTPETVHVSCWRTGLKVKSAEVKSANK